MGIDDDDHGIVVCIMNTVVFSMSDYGYATKKTTVVVAEAAAEQSSQQKKSSRLLKNSCIMCVFIIRLLW